MVTNGRWPGAYAVSEEVEEVKQEEGADLALELEKMKEELAKAQAHNKELFADAKKRQKERDEVKKQAFKEKEERAIKDGEYEKLYQSATEREKELEKTLAEFKDGIKQEKIKHNSLKIASELTAKQENAELLSHFVQMKVQSLADEAGNVPADVMANIKIEMSNDKKFAALVAGSQATGGGAPGSGSGAKAEAVTRAEFAKWDSGKQMKYMKSGNTLID